MVIFVKPVRSKQKVYRLVSNLINPKHLTEDYICYYLDSINGKH